MSRHRSVTLTDADIRTVTRSDNRRRWREALTDLFGTLVVAALFWAFLIACALYGVRGGSVW